MRIVDTFQFMVLSLDTLAKNLVKHEFRKEIRVSLLLYRFIGEMQGASIIPQSECFPAISAQKTSRTPNTSIHNSLENFRQPEHGGVLGPLREVGRPDLGRHLREFQKRLHKDLLKRPGMVFHSTQTREMLCSK